MRDVTGQGCNLSPPVRDDLPLHDQTGGSTWLPGLLSTMYPGEVDEAALQAGIARARYMLQNAAELAVVKEGANLKVTITNNTGHKLPTGYPEGRRMWINVKFYDASMALISESGAYDTGSGVLSHDPEAKIYEIKPGLDSVTAPLVGVPEGPSFHFVLNNKIFGDNRIPPRGFTNAAYADFGGAPVGYSYADGQYWDDTLYAIPPGAVSAEVTLYYQSTSKEFVEFLRDENTTNTKGQELYDLWNNNGKCPPEIMAQAQVSLLDCSDGDEDGYDAFHAVDCPTGDDCDDSDPDVNPGAEETCDGVDNNCVDGIDEEPLASASCDNGDFCDGVEYCDAASCQAGTPVDCDDGNACTDDSCDEGGDSCENQCNATDPADPCCDNPACTGNPICVGDCVDNDGDGYGDPADPDCTHPELDCNDSNLFVFPGAPEFCDGVDNQCPGDAGYGEVDEGCPSSCTGTAAASTIGASPVYGPHDLGRHMIYLLLPMGAVVLLTIRRRKR
jgi:hypothetical protein